MKMLVPSRILIGLVTILALLSPALAAQQSGSAAGEASVAIPASKEDVIVTDRLTDGQEGARWGLAPTGRETAELVLDLEPGSYLFASFPVTTASLTLDLEAPDGAFLRRLLQPGDARGDFNLVIGSRGERLVARFRGGPSDAAQAGPLVLTFDKLVAPSDLHARADTSPVDSPRLRALVEGLATAEAPQALLQAFWDEMAEQGTPLVEPAENGKSRLTFLYRGARSNVRILGSPSADHDLMHQLPGTDVWYRTYLVPDDTRLSYRLAPDIPDVPGTFWENRVAILATARRDPLNKAPWPAEAPDAWRQKSVVELPQAPAQPFVSRQPGTAAGTVETVDFTSVSLGNTRQVSLYRPADFDPQDPETVLLVLFDGASYQSDVDVPAMLDQMQADGVIPQTAAILVSNPDGKARSAELPGSADFSQVMAREIVPFGQECLGLAVPAARTVLSGSSYGGLASMRLALDHPEVFGNVLSMSGSFWWSPEGTPATDAEFIARRAVSEPRKDLRVFLTAGLFETSRDGSLDILNTNRHLRDVLEARGYPVTLREYAGAHDYLVWRGALADGLLALFGPAP